MTDLQKLLNQVTTVISQTKLATIGIDIGGTNLRLALVSPTGKILERRHIKSLIEDGREAFCSRLLSEFNELVKLAQNSNIIIQSAGIGIPGLIDKHGTIQSSINMRPLENFNLAKFIEKNSGIPTLSDNDANLSALGELQFGSAKGLKSFMAITIGTGFGSGLVLDGKIWRGANGFAAEFGHSTIEPTGRVCKCGNHGCLEQYVSAGAIIKTAAESAEEPAGILDIDTEMLAKRARAGDKNAINAFQQTGRWLGIALASLCNTLNLQAVIVGGGISASFDLLLPTVRQELNSRLFPQIAADFSVIKSKLGDDAGLLGAAVVK